MANPTTQMRQISKTKKVNLQYIIIDSLMQMQGGKPECASGRTDVRSDRMNGAADNADAQNIEKSAAYARKAARRAAENIAAPDAARMLAPAACLPAGRQGRENIARQACRICRRQIGRPQTKQNFSPHRAPGAKGQPAHCPPEDGEKSAQKPNIKRGGVSRLYRDYRGCRRIVFRFRGV